MASATRDAALSYRQRGWSVIPISPVSKKPPKDFKWTEFQDRLAEPREIEAWWRKWPNAGVGIVTGKISDLVVLDVDPKHGADPNHIYQTYPTPIVSLTGRGGGHFFYQYPAHEEYVPNVVGKQDGKPTGYDIRADGGYVVAPPSLHPSGKRYEWISNSAMPVIMPSKLWGMVTSAIKPAPNGKATSKEPWLADALKGVGEGARDDTCARLAGYYLSKGMPEDVVIEQLKMWNERNDQSGTPFTDRDIEKTVKSVARTRERHPERSQPGRMQAADLSDDPDDLLRLMSLHHYMSRYGALDVRWAVEGWLPDETIAMLVSPPGTYKTWLLIDLAVSIATGTPFLGSAAIRRTGSVLIFQQEDFHGQIAQRIGAVMHGRFVMGPEETLAKDAFSITLPPSPPIYLHDNRELRFDDEEVMDVLEARVAELRPALVIVDPLYTAAPMDDYMAKAVPHMMRLKRMRDLYRTSFILAHHTGKRSKESGREDLWGSQFLNAFLETGWQVRPQAEGQALIKRHFKVSKDFPESILAFDIETGQYPGHYRTTMSAVGDVPGIEQVGIRNDIRILDCLTKYGPLNGSELAKRLRMSRSGISRKVQKMIAGGAIRLGMDNRYRGPEHFDVPDLPNGKK